MNDRASPDRKLSPGSLLLTACALAAASDPALAQSLPDDIDITTSPNGVVPLPPTVDPVFTNIFDRYTKITAPNGQAIHFLLQSQVTDEMAVRAREVMRFYLTDVPGSQYGADKTDVANLMGLLEAALVYFNNEAAANQAMNGPLGNADIFAQDLYATESVVEASWPYLFNTVRDATLEEVFHLVHGAGIRWTFPAYHQEIVAATNAAIAAGFYFPPPGLPPWDRPFEYIISVIDVYYGFWAHDPDNDGTSFGGEYTFNTRAAVEAGDPQGVTVMRKFLPEHFSASLTAAASFQGTFLLAFDGGVEYTHKSRYLTDLRLWGSHPSGLVGNDLENVLGGNAGDNAIAGGGGTDTVVFQGPRAEYVVSGNQVADTVGGRDGTDTLDAVEWLEFSDQTVPFDGGSAVSYCTSSPNSSGAAALISHSGSLDVSANDLVLHATPVPPNQPGIFFYGATPNQVPFGNGTLCVSQPVVRLGVTFASGLGELDFEVDNQAPAIGGDFTAGSVWNFQAWFRDPAAGDATYDLSDGLRITFAL
ncbi:MAG: hypothetical protein QF903_07270 [Planctomycetota bacterium]|jgi:hypothetical protein|nr:hypothetical protein [Planctomycetota bacterium]MDP6762449.1 hypothetical protein [Planctomycetota bacterium]MDP6989265.1 hypothetical protein [Planctomycetota bacterium]